MVKRLVVLIEFKQYWRIFALKMNKKGISPLIATVLLVSFVVILSGVIMFWGRQYVTELMEKRGETAVVKQECVTGVSFDVVSANGPRVSIVNSGDVKLSGFILKFSGQPSCDIVQSVKPYPLFSLITPHTLWGARSLRLHTSKYLKDLNRVVWLRCFSFNPSFFFCF